MLVSSLFYYKTREQISNDIVANTTEVAGGFDWEKIIGRHFALIHQGRRYIGRAAITFSVAQTIGSAAANMGWNMHSPEAVYMSGYHVLYVLKKTLRGFNQRIEDTEEGKRTFLNEEARLATLQKERTEAERLKRATAHLKNSLKEYAHQNLPYSQDDLYLKILQALIYIKGKRLSSSERKKVFELLRNNSLDQAFNILK